MILAAKERELSFYGAEDFIPTKEYNLEDADLAIKEAGGVLKREQGALSIADDHG